MLVFVFSTFWFTFPAPVATPAPRGQPYNITNTPHFPPHTSHVSTLLCILISLLSRSHPELFTPDDNFPFGLINSSLPRRGSFFHLKTFCLSNYASTVTVGEIIYRCMHNKSLTQLFLYPSCDSLFTLLLSPPPLPTRMRSTTSPCPLSLLDLSLVPSDLHSLGCMRSATSFQL